MNQKTTVSGYLLQRLQEIGINHLFGVPGDYNLDFLDNVLKSPLEWVGTCNELNAGYAADGYARLNGASAAVVTYGVGGLSIVNAVAGAYAEHVPMIVINGAPPARRRESGALVHHLVAHYYLQLDIFKSITAGAVLLTDPVTAPQEIDKVIFSCLTRKLPGYIELPADMVNAPCDAPGQLKLNEMAASDPDSLRDAVSETASRLNQAASPVLLAGVELFRYGLGKESLNLVERSEIPFATMLSSKSVLPELHPQFMGIYQGAWSKPAVRQQVEESDCLLNLGAWFTDLDTGMFSISLDPRRMISVGGGQVRIGSHYYENVQLSDFIRELSLVVQPRSYLTSHPASGYQPKKVFAAEPDTTLTAVRLYECVDYFLDDQMILLSEPGDAFCASPEFHIEEAENFIVQAYYCSIGFCTPAALGVFKARPHHRPVILSGDGAFQMTAQEVSTLIRQKCPAIIIIVNNDGYLIERKLHEDGLYNDIQMWKYSELPSAFGGEGFGKGIRVTDEEQLEKAMRMAVADKERLYLIEARIPGRDCSAGLERLGNTFRQAQAKKA